MTKTNTRTCILYSIVSCFITGFLIFTCPITACANSEGVTERIKAATQTFNKHEQVDTHIPLPKNSVKVHMEYQGGAFFTESRKTEISRYKCSSCHNNKPVLIRNAADVSHADIRVVHGEKGKPLDCNTCHSSEDRDYLQNSKGKRIDLDHSYEMCGECHFRQKKDWVGGAHGKRVTYWAGERVVKNCASCHNPHSPRFDKKWPATYSVPLK